MKILTAKNEDIVIIGLEGRLDAETSKDIQDEFFAIIESAVKIIIDCGRLAYISSAGFRLMYKAGQILSVRNGRMVFCSVNENIMSLFEVIDFSSDFDIFPNKEKAEKGMR